MQRVPKSSDIAKMNLRLRAESRSRVGGLAIQTIRCVKCQCVVYVPLFLIAEKRRRKRHKKYTSKEFTREIRN